MNDIDLPKNFRPNQPDAAGIVSWVHLGDLHMDGPDAQNHTDLHALVTKVNEQFAQAISFVFLPGDNADHGSVKEYELVRGALDRLNVPWCAIVGDHDVHEKSFENFLRYMAPETRYRFQVGDVNFFALNAFGTPKPDSFELSSDELAWVRDGLRELPDASRVVVLVHCYPSDLKQGRDELQEIVDDPRVMLVEMGHTHYNEVSNDGSTLYAATRSTGQIEEGPVGFSISNIDGDVVSWKFAPLTEESLLIITSPADERFLTSSSRPADAKDGLTVRAKAWGKAPVSGVSAHLNGQTIQLEQIAKSQVWQGTWTGQIEDGVHELSVTGRDGNGAEVRDAIRVRIGAASQEIERKQRDQDNPIPVWPERGLLGTQLGPNKNGKKW